jgi:hypothetical protein
VESDGCEGLALHRLLGNHLAKLLSPAWHHRPEEPFPLMNATLLYPHCFVNIYIFVLAVSPLKKGISLPSPLRKDLTWPR